MKVLIISTSLRRNSNSDILADEFAKGAKISGHEIEKISLIGKEIKFCTGCDICQKTRKCVIKDDANEIVEKMHRADIIVFAAPVYFGGISGQMQTLLDRTYSLFPWKLNAKQTHKFYEVYLLTTSSGSELKFTDLVVEKIKEWVKHFNGTWLECPKPLKLAGIVRGLGVHEAGEIRKSDAVLRQAFEMGKKV